MPLAWALRAAGHRVLIATCGESAGAAVSAGLPVWDVAPGIELASEDSLRNEFRLAPGGLPAARPEESGGRILTKLAEAMAGGLMRAAQEYRPQALIYTPAAAAAPFVAARLQIPAIFLGVGLAQRPKVMFEGAYQSMGSLSDQLGVASVLPPSCWIDVAPPSLRPAPSDGLPMRYVPYNGGGAVDFDLIAPRRGRPLVAITLGTVVPRVVGGNTLQALIAAAGDVNADFIVAHASADFGVPGGLPPNVRATPWIAFDGLFEHCSAVIHHGGSGTMMTALHGGLPQMLLPFGGDQFYNAAALARRGAARVAAGEAIDPRQIQALLDDERLRAAAGEIGREIAAMPSPSDLVSRIVAIAI